MLPVNSEAPPEGDLSEKLQTRWSPHQMAQLETLASELGCGKAEALRRLVCEHRVGVLPTRALVCELVKVGAVLGTLLRSEKLDSDDKARLHAALADYGRVLAALV
jgi:hypothetical protein